MASRCCRIASDAPLASPALPVPEAAAGRAPRRASETVEVDVACAVRNRETFQDRPERTLAFTAHGDVDERVALQERLGAVRHVGAADVGG